AFQGRKFKGVITEIASSSTMAASASGAAGTDQVTNFNVKVRILPASYQDLLNEDEPNPSPFRPGLSATVEIHTRSDNGLAVPIQSVTTREAIASDSTDVGQADARAGAGPKKVREYVFVYDGAGTVKQVEVTTGIQDDMYIRVLSGLQEGDEVVSRPFNAISTTLRDGASVEKVDRSAL